jgi:hypothetical protein
MSTYVGDLYKAKDRLLIFDAKSRQNITVDKGSYWLKRSDNYSKKDGKIVEDPLIFVMCVRSDKHELEGMLIGLKLNIIEKYFEFEGVSQVEENFFDTELKGFV